MDDLDIFRLDGHCLRIFVSVFETNSVSRSAALFGLNQSTVSHHIDRMRGAVGDPLFVKSGRGIMPTEKAIALFPRVQGILSEIEGLREPERFVAAADRRPFVIAIPTPAVLEDIRALYARLTAISPDIQMHLLRLAPRDKVTELLTEGSADLAITVRGMRYPPTLNYCPYGQDDLVVFYDPAMRGPVERLEDFAEAKHAVVSFGGGTKSVVDEALARLGLKRKVVLVAPTASMLCELIKGTSAIATMPKRLNALAGYQALSSSAPPFPAPQVEYELVWHRRNDNSGRSLWLRQQVMAVASDTYTDV